MADMGEFPYPLDVMPTFVLQVAPVDVHGGHVKDLPSHPLPFYPLRGFLLSLYLYVSCSLHHFFLYVDRRVKLPLVLLKPSGDKKYGMKCHTTLLHVVVQLTPKY